VESGGVIMKTATDIINLFDLDNQIFEIKGTFSAAIVTGKQ